MPARKRLALAGAVAGGLALLAGAGLLARDGHAVAAGVASVAILALGAAVAHALWPSFDVTGSTLRRGPRGRREVALTFDDGPSPDTPAVLDALDAAGVRATFFVLG